MNATRDFHVAGERPDWRGDADFQRGYTKGYEQGHEEGVWRGWSTAAGFYIVLTVVVILVFHFLGAH